MLMITQGLSGSSLGSLSRQGTMDRHSSIFPGRVEVTTEVYRRISDVMREWHDDQNWSWYILMGRLVA